jgi:hypothetical protein
VLAGPSHRAQGPLLDDQRAQLPETIAPNNSAHLRGQPYTSLVHVTPRSAVDTAPGMICYLNARPIAYAFHPHRQHEMEVGEGELRSGAAQVTQAAAVVLSHM